MQDPEHAVSPLWHRLETALTLGGALEELRAALGGYEIVAHCQQGEFHHDVVVRVPNTPLLPGSYLVLATNCNGGIKEVLCFDAEPDCDALWHWRCPDNPEFSGSLPTPLSTLRTTHWFDPCELLRPDARSELREQYRKRQRGGGWQPA